MDSSASNSDNSNTIVVTTVQACIEAVASVEEDGKVPIVLCTGSDDPQSGVSWCPDCVTADPVIEKVMHEHGSDQQVLIICKVGDRTAWKNPKNPFRTHEKFQINCIPTIFVWGTHKRLTEAQCVNEHSVELLFED